MPYNSRSKNNRLRLYWNFRAFFYALFYNIPIISEISKRERLAILKLFSESIPTNNIKYTLDLGCGTNPLFTSISSACNIGLDWSLKSLIWSKKNYANAKLISGDTYNLPIKDNSISLIVALGLAEYIQSPIGWLEEIARILAPNGYLIFTCAPANTISHIRRLYNPKLNLCPHEWWIEQCESLNLELIRHIKLPLQTQFIFNFKIKTKKSHSEAKS